MVVYNRGNRDWVQRETIGKTVTLAKGAQWTMNYTLDLAPDLNSLQGYVSVTA